MTVMFNHCRDWRRFRGDLARGFLAPEPVRNEDAAKNRALAALAAAAIPVTWFCGNDYGLSHFGPCTVLHPLSYLAAGELYLSAQRLNNAMVVIATPPGWSGLVVLPADGGPVSQADVELLLSAGERVDIVVTWPVALSEALDFKEKNGGPDDEQFLRQWDYLALFVADCALRADVCRRLTRIREPRVALQGAAALLDYLYGLDWTSKATPSARFTTCGPVDPAAWATTLGHVVELRRDDARLSVGLAGSVDEVIEQVRREILCVLGVEVSRDGLLDIDTR